MELDGPVGGGSRSLGLLATLGVMVFLAFGVLPLHEGGRVAHDYLLGVFHRGVSGVLRVAEIGFLVLMIYKGALWMAEVLRATLRIRK